MKNAVYISYSILLLFCSFTMFFAFVVTLIHVFKTSKSPFAYSLISFTAANSVIYATYSVLQFVDINNENYVFESQTANIFYCLL